MRRNIATIDLRDNQWHLSLHPMGRGIIDNNGAGLHSNRRVFQRDSRPGAEKCKVDILEGVYTEGLDGKLLTTELESLAGGARGGEKLDR